MNSIDFMNIVDFLYWIIVTSAFGFITGRCLCILYREEVSNFIDKAETFFGDLLKGFKLQFTRRK